MTDDPKPQPDKFRDAARELECDEDEAKFEGTLNRVIRGAKKAPPTPSAPKAREQSNK